MGKYGPITVPKWPQDSLAPPTAGARFMPPVALGNIDIARQESFTMSATIDIPGATVALKTFTVIVPTDQDGDFWCDQIYAIAHRTGTVVTQALPPATLAISDIRTGKAITYPAGVPLEIFTNYSAFGGGGGGINTGNRPYPNGLRSTSTLMSPFCFTRQGGIQLVLQVTDVMPATAFRVDIAFGGWKEYEYASGN